MAHMHPVNFFISAISASYGIQILTIYVISIVLFFGTPCSENNGIVKKTIEFVIYSYRQICK